MQFSKFRKMLQLIMVLLLPVIFFYFSPAIIIMGAARGVVVGGLFTFAALFLISLYFGRGFCGWVCAAGGLQEICFNINDRPVRRGKWLKYLIWVPWLLTILVLLVRAGGIKKVDPLFLTNQGFSLGTPASYLVYFIVVGTIVGMAFLIGKRSFCQHICWMAPLMVIGTALRNLVHLPGLRLAVEREKCNQCKLCNKKCPMSLDVMALVQQEKMYHQDCILCGECVANCPKQAIGFKF